MWGGPLCSRWHPLRPPQNTKKTKAIGTTGTRGPVAPRKPTKSRKSFEKQRKAYECPSELIQESPGILHDLTDALFIRFRETKASTTPRARPRPRWTRSTNQRLNPSDRITPTRTIQISRCDSPPASDISLRATPRPKKNLETF